MNKYCLGKGGFGEESWCSFFLGIPTSWMGIWKGSEGKALRDLPLLLRSVCVNQGCAFAQGLWNGWSWKKTRWLFGNGCPPPLPLGKCGFLECRLQRCPGTDSAVIVKECVRHWVAPDICFLPNRIVFKSKSPVTRTMGGLYLLQSGSFSEPLLSHPFPLAYMLQFWLVVARG